MTDRMQVAVHVSDILHSCGVSKETSMLIFDRLVDGLSRDNSITLEQVDTELTAILGRIYYGK